MRVVLMDTVPEALNQGDVYILDCIKTLYVWHGMKHSPLKKAKVSFLRNFSIFFLSLSVLTFYNRVWK